MLVQTCVLELRMDKLIRDRAALYRLAVNLRA